MANEPQSDWQNNKEMNIKENSSVTDEGLSITDEDQQGSWREAETGDQTEGSAQADFRSGAATQKARDNNDQEDQPDSAEGLGIFDEQADQ
jgi:hypothetical protein